MMSDQLISALVCFVCVCVYVWVGGASDGFEGSESSVETLCFSDLHHYDVRTTYRLFFSDCPPDLSPLHGCWLLLSVCRLFRTNNNTLASGARDSSIRIWNRVAVKKGSHKSKWVEAQKLSGHIDTINCLCILPDFTLVSGSQVHFFFLRGGGCVDSFFRIL